MPIVFESLKDPYGIGAAGTILGNALMQRNMEALQNKRQIESEGRQTQSQIDAEKRKIEQMREEQTHQGGILSNAINGLDLTTPEGIQQAVLNYYQGGGTGNNLMELLKVQAQERIAANKPQPQPKPTRIQNKLADQVADTILSVPKIQSMGKTIDRIQELIPQVSGPLGMAKGILGLGEATNEINALGLSVLEPVLKIFNPVGAIATRKMELLKDKYAIKATDTTEQINGKLNFYRKLQKEGMEKAQRLSDLYEEYNGNIPEKELLKFSEEASNSIDNYLKGNDSQTFPKLPSAADYKGKKMIDEDSGTVFESNGTNWRKVK